MDTTSSTPPAPAPLTTPHNTEVISGVRKWTPLMVLSLALTIIILDTTILNVSLRAIIIDLHTTIQNIQWVITAYSLILAAFTITGGRLGDLFGRKKMFIWGAIIFAIGSFITSISKSVGVMIAGESIIEGIGAALMMPATASLLVSNYQGRDRAIAFGIWGGIIAAAAALGPVVGGWLTTSYTWRWAFRINIGVAALLILGSLLIKEAKSEEKRPSLDFGGIVLSALGLLSIVFGFIKASAYGWLTAKEELMVFGYTIHLGGISATPLFLFLGIIILTIFAFWEKRVAENGKTPLVSLKLFQNKQFVTGASITAILILGQTGLSFSIPIFLQAVKGFDALHTGIAMLPMSLAILVAAPLSSYINKFVSAKYLIQTGLFLTTISFFVMRWSLHVDASAWDLAPGFALFGFGMGLIMAQASNLTLSAVPLRESGEASGVNNTLRQVGASLGAAIMGAILLSALSTNVMKGITDSAVIPDEMKPAISSAVSSQTSNIEFGTGALGSTSQAPSAIQSEIISISHQATVDANRTTLLYGAVFIFLGLLVSVKLPAGKIDHPSPGEIKPSVAH